MEDFESVSSILNRSESILSSDSVSDSSFDEEQYRDLKELSTPNDVALFEEKLMRNFPNTSFGDININNSSNIILGNIIKIKGDLIIKTDKSENNTNIAKSKLATHNLLNEQIDEKIPQHFKSDKNYLTNFIPREQWLAMEPDDDYSYLEDPAEFVIIAHTTTTSSTEMSKNMVIVRDIQAFHIGSQDWGDIGYNFLIGCDGNIYEGRGWGVVGAHTYGYNKISIGIAFIGCFVSKLPTLTALEACKKLLQIGKEEGRLPSNFKLMGHLQCISTQSPGKRLYKEIQTWEHFYENIEN
ncbi:peptidoglycan recognition protein-like [Haematobia irritans]|uniref:peptidoglycan recognition protein-like n=1 Tax=Haematobia irritans TaxID=7368 RepID=UPI003F4FFA98